MQTTLKTTSTDHIAIMRSDWNLIPKILAGEKKIESRWYKAKTAPWNNIAQGDTVYFKDAGKPVTAKAEVEKVLQFENYSDTTLREIINQYGGIGGINFVSNPKEVFLWAQERKYCILMFLKNPQRVEPFQIDKNGYGNACAWMCVGDVEKVRIDSK